MAAEAQAVKEAAARAEEAKRVVILVERRHKVLHVHRCETLLVSHDVLDGVEEASEPLWCGPVSLIRAHIVAMPALYDLHVRRRRRRA